MELFRLFLHRLSLLKTRTRVHTRLFGLHTLRISCNLLMLDRIPVTRHADVRLSYANLVFGLITSLYCCVDVTAQVEKLPQHVKVAAVQISGYDKTDLPRKNFDPVKPIVSYINQAGTDAADLVVFPEYVLGHISVPGLETQQIAAAAKRNRIYVIVGCWEVANDTTYSNTALIFDRDGKICGKYRKTHAAVDTFEGKPAYARAPRDRTQQWFLTNDPEWTMEKGDSLPVFEFDFGKVGIMTCYDGWFPEPPRILSLQGAELIVWINGRRGKVEEFIVKTITFQSHVSLVATNQAYGSGTMIADHGNKILASAPDRTEAYISATLDLDSVRKRRKGSRNFQQRRPDLYQPLLKEIPK